MIRSVRSLPLGGLILGLALTSGITGCGPGDPESIDLAEISTPEALTAFGAELLDDPDRVRRTRRLIALLEVLPADRFPELAGTLDGRTVTPRQEDLGLVMHVWARVDPERALDQAVEWKTSGVTWPEPITLHAVNEVFYAWAQDASADVESAVITLPVDMLTGANVAVVRGWTESGQVARATRHILDAEEILQQPLLSVLAARLAEDQGVEAAIEWAESVPEAVKLNAFRRTAAVVARVAPNRAAAWAHENSGRRHARGMARFLGTEWARQAGPEPVLAWIDTLPTESERREASTWVFKDWSRRDPEAAMRWIQNRNPLEATYRPVIGAHLRSLLAVDPGRAIRWTEDLADSDRRGDAELMLAHAWLAADEEAARDWIREAGLEEAVAEAAARRAEAQAKRRHRQPK